MVFGGATSMKKLFVTPLSVISHPALASKMYEFETEGVEVEGVGIHYYFRLDIAKDGTKTVYSSNTEDFDVHEDCTDLFDTDDVLKQCEKAEEEETLSLATHSYLTYLVEDVLERDIHSDSL
jgi:hypothetical protein